MTLENENRALKAENQRLREALLSSKHFLDNALAYGAILEHDRPKAEYTLEIVNKALKEAGQ